MRGSVTAKLETYFVLTQLVRDSRLMPSMIAVSTSTHVYLFKHQIVGNRQSYKLSLLYGSEMAAVKEVREMKDKF
jgi:hypothetical protein